jgi:hypothetical protein
MITPTKAAVACNAFWLKMGTLGSVLACDHQRSSATLSWSARASALLFPQAYTKAKS